MTLRGKIIYLKNFRTDILADAIEDSRIDFEYTRDGKGELRKTKEFSHEKWTQWEDIIYNYIASNKKGRSVTLSYVIRNDTPSPKYRENRDMQTIYHASLVGNIFTRESRKVIEIIKELTLGTDADA